MPTNKSQSRLKQTLKANGFKITSARLRLLETLAGLQKPLSVKTISRKLKTRSCDTATLYRNLKNLAAKKLVEEVVLDGKKIYYELSNRAHHHHLICRACGQVQDVKNCQVKPLSQKILKHLRFKKIQRHSLEFFGLCQKCSAR